MEIKKQIKKLKIKKIYSAFVDDFKKAISGLLSDKLNSIYICGSIPSGKAKPGRSDADFTIVVGDELNETEYNEIETIKQELLKKYPFITKIDTPVCMVKDVKEKPYEWGFWIKIVSICIYGTDLGRNVPPLKPSLELIRDLNTDTIDVIQGGINSINRTEEKNQLKLKCRKISRKLIRALFSLTVVRVNFWTDDVRKQIKILKKVYPEKREFVKRLFAIYKRSIYHRHILLSIIKKTKELFQFEYRAIITGSQKNKRPPHETDRTK